LAFEEGPVQEDEEPAERQVHHQKCRKSNDILLPFEVYTELRWELLVPADDLDAVVGSA
jgi:hypothetical protein